jgi:hypothetical protein
MIYRIVLVCVFLIVIMQHTNCARTALVYFERLYWVFRDLVLMRQTQLESLILAQNERWRQA